MRTKGLSAAFPMFCVLQKINTDVFRDPDGLMENIVRVTAFLRTKIAARGGNPDRETLTVVPTHDGAPYLRDPDGGCWRVYPFIEDTISYQTVDQPEVFEAAAEKPEVFQLVLDKYYQGKRDGRTLRMLGIE